MTNAYPCNYLLGLLLPTCRLPEYSAHPCKHLVLSGLWRFRLFVVLCGYPHKNQRGLELKIILSIENDEEPFILILIKIHQLSLSSIIISSASIICSSRSL